MEGTKHIELTESIRNNTGNNENDGDDGKVPRRDISTRNKSLFGNETHLGELFAKEEEEDLPQKPSRL